MKHISENHISEDKVNSMLFDVEYEIISKTEEMIKIIKSRSARVFDSKIVTEIETLIEKRYNLIGACLVFEYEELK